MGSYSHLALAGDEKTKLKLHYDGSLFANSRLVAALRALGAFVGELGEVSMGVHVALINRPTR